MIASKTKLEKTLIRTDGHIAKAAKIIGMTPQALHDRINNNPDIKKTVKEVRDAALKAAKISRARVYKGISEGLDAKLVIIKDGEATVTKAPDHKERRENRKIALQLLGDLDPDTQGGDKTFNLVQVFLPQKEPIIDVEAST